MASGRPELAALACAGLVLLVCPASASAVETVRDGGFEAAICNATDCAEPGVWTEAPDVTGSAAGPLCSSAIGECFSADTSPRTGTKYVMFGNAYNGDATGTPFGYSASVSQTVTIPSGSATLSFYRDFFDAEGTSTLNVSIDGTQIYGLTGGPGTPTLAAADVSSFADGGSHTLSFSYTASGVVGDSGFSDGWAVDDVSLAVTLPPTKPPGGGGAADADPPGATLAGSKRQKLGRFVVVTVASDEAGTASATGTLRVAGLAKKYKLGKAAKRVARGAKVKLKLKVSKKARRAATKALKKGKKVTAKIIVTVRDEASNSSSKRRTIRLKR